MDTEQNSGHGYWYDAFIAHAEADLNFARDILTAIEEKGLKCIFALRDFKAGHAIVENIASAIHRSRKIIMIVSKASLKSEWCNYEMLAAINESHAQNSVKLLPVILQDVPDEDIPMPLRFVVYIHMARDRNYLEKLLSALSCQDVAWETLLPAGNLAHGLAWSYYYGYLKLILPGIDQRIRDSPWWSNIYGERKISQKIFLLFPESCLCRSTLTDDDPQITHAGHLETVTVNRAGTVGRPYKSTVYRINLEEEHGLYFVGEYITAIHTMYEMENGQKSGLNSDDKRLQATRFFITIQDILERDPECSGKYKILYYKDAPSDGRTFRIADELSKAIKKEISKEVEQENSCGRQTFHLDTFNEETQMPLEHTVSTSRNDENGTEFLKEEPIIVTDDVGKAKYFERDGSFINFFKSPEDESW